MSRGTLTRARRRAARPHRGRCKTIPPAVSRNGGCTFAEAPDVPAPQARIIWSAELDPNVLSAEALRVAPTHCDRLELARLQRYLLVVCDDHGIEHAVLSDGWRRIRLDIRGGSLCARAPLILRYHLSGFASAEPGVAALVRLIDLHRRGSFRLSLFPQEPRAGRWALLLRVSDAIAEGARQRDIAEVLFGADRTRDQWRGRSDALRSNVRRLIRDMHAMAGGGWRTLLRREGSPRRLCCRLCRCGSLPAGRSCGDPPESIIVE